MAAVIDAMKSHTFHIGKRRTSLSACLWRRPSSADATKRRPDQWRRLTGLAWRPMWAIVGVRPSGRFRGAGRDCTLPALPWRPRPKRNRFGRVRARLLAALGQGGQHHSANARQVIRFYIECLPAEILAAAAALGQDQGRRARHGGLQRRTARRVEPIGQHQATAGGIGVAKRRIFVTHVLDELHMWASRAVALFQIPFATRARRRPAQPPAQRRHALHRGIQVGSWGSIRPR